MVTISLCMIVRDEEEVLGRCLDSVYDIVDEIIIVDTGSKDKTRKIAKKYTSKIYDFKWIDDFSAARNYSFSKATKDYIFWIDADDVLLEEDRKKFKQIKELMNTDIDVVMMKYNLGSDNKGKAKISFFRERLLKRINNYKWESPVHEYIKLYGKICNSDICITHKKERARTKRNLEIFEKYIAKGQKLNNRNMFYYARELYINKRYDKAMKYYLKFLDTEKGNISDYLDSCIDLAKIYEIKNDKKNCLKTLIRSFEYETPRAEICCYIGYYYKELKDYKKAFTWFKLAANLDKPDKKWGFVIHDFYDFIPNMEMSICSYRLGDIKTALYYNDIAGKYKPNHKAVTNNKLLLTKVLLENNK